MPPVQTRPASCLTGLALAAAVLLAAPGAPPARAQAAGEDAPGIGRSGDLISEVMRSRGAPSGRVSGGTRGIGGPHGAGDAAAAAPRASAHPTRRAAGTQAGRPPAVRPVISVAPRASTPPSAVPSSPRAGGGARQAQAALPD